MHFKRSRPALLLALLAMALAAFTMACGTDEEESGTSGSNKGEGIRAGSGSRTDKARAPAGRRPPRWAARPSSTATRRSAS